MRFAAGWLGRDCDFIVVNTIEVRATGDPRVRVYRAYGKKISFGVLPEGFTTAEAAAAAHRLDRRRRRAGLRL